MPPTTVRPEFAAGRWGCAGVSALSRPAGRRGFTLVEMLVALAVLIIAITIVASVFSLTTQTAQQAAAIVEIESHLRNFAVQIKEDLDGVRPSESILVVHSRNIAAALTEEDRQAGKHLRFLEGDPNAVQSGFDPKFSQSTTDPNDAWPYRDPAADILMFFSHRPQASQAPPTAGNMPSPETNVWSALQTGTKFAPVQLVYGHAARDNVKVVTPGGASPPVHGFDETNVRHIEHQNGAENLSPLPVVRWQLARRATILLPRPANLFDPGNPKLFFNGDGSGNSASDEFRRILRCYSENTSYAGDAAELDYASLLREFGPKPVTHNFLAPLLIPYDVDGGPTGPWPNELRTIINPLIYPDDATARQLNHVATVLSDPPADLETNLGVQSVPACAWFEVEFLMPEDPRNSPTYFDRLANNRNRRDDMPRWVRMPPGETAVFVPDTKENRDLVTAGWAGPLAPQTDPPRRIQTFGALDRSLLGTQADSVKNRNVRLWPYAIRVTVRAFDRNGRLPEPLERVVVHWFD